MPVEAPSPGLHVGAQGVLPTGAEQRADRPRLASSLLQRNMTEQSCGGCLDVPGSVEALPGHRAPGAIATAK